MPKFRHITGLTAYAFACGYIQRFDMLDEEGLLRIDLWHEGACYHARVTLEGERREWVSEGNLGDARAQWHKFVRYYAGSRLKQIKKDKRYSVAREFHGEGDPSWVARFCARSGQEEVIYAADGSSGTFGCSTPEQAWARCYSHNWNRMDYEARRQAKPKHS